MELQQDFIEKHGLSEELVTELNGKITSTIEDIIPAKELEIENKYRGQANTNAEAIIGGAAKSLIEGFGLETKRADGEKIKDYFHRVKTDFSSSLEDMKKDALKDVDSKEFLELQEKYDESLKKLANFDEVTDKANKYETLLEKNLRLKNENAFSSVKPSFSSEANEYEVKAKWGNFVKDIESRYNIENVEGVYKAIDKENPHKIKSLQDLVKENEDLSSLTGLRNQGGLNLKNSKDGVKKDGLPFTIPKNAEKSEISAKINAYIAKENIPSSKRDETFLKYWKLATA